MAKESKAFEFGPFRLEVRERRLTRDGHAVPLRGRVFDTLCVLITNHGRLVTKDELIAAVWPDSVVEDSNLNHNICILRRAFGEKVTGQRYIETVPRQGYRFVAEVKELAEPEEPATSDSWGAFQEGIAATNVKPEAVPDSSNIDSQPQTRKAASEPASPAQPRRFSRTAIIALAAVLGLLAIVHIEVQRFRHMSRLASLRPILAVLPFENLTGNPAEDYISDGLSQEIISQLGVWNPSRLGVIGRTSSRIYRGTKKSIGEIGRELGVDYIIEGSVRTDGKRVRITVLLIRVNDQSHLWAANYDRDAESVTALQVEVTQAIVREIGSRIAVKPVEGRLTVHTGRIETRGNFNRLLPAAPTASLPEQR